MYWNCLFNFKSYCSKEHCARFIELDLQEVRTNDDCEVEIEVRINPKLDVSQEIGSCERGDNQRDEMQGRIN